MCEIKNIVFDLGNVILRYDPEAMLLRYTSDPQEIDLCVKTVFGSPQWQACDRGDGTREEILPACMEKLPPKLRAYCEDICYRRNLELIFMPPVPGIAGLIRELKAAGYGIYLLSNIGVSFHWICDDLPELKLFDGLFASGDYHVLKPEPEIFRLFFEKFGLTPENCLFVDDNPANCAGSRAAGMRAVCFNGSKSDAKELRSLLTADGVKL